MAEKKSGSIGGCMSSKSTTGADADMQPSTNCGSVRVFIQHTNSNENFQIRKVLTNQPTKPRIVKNRELKNTCIQYIHDVHM